MELLYQSKSTPRTLLDQFLNSAPICLISSSLLIPGPRFFQPHPSRNPSFWSSYVLEITYFPSYSKKNLSRNKKIFTEFLEYPVRKKNLSRNLDFFVKTRKKKNAHGSGSGIEPHTTQKKIQKRRTTPAIPTWSPTAVLSELARAQLRSSEWVPALYREYDRSRIGIPTLHI